MKYKLRASAEHLNQLWKQTHLSDSINLTQFGSLWIKRLICDASVPHKHCTCISEGLPAAAHEEMFYSIFWNQFNSAAFLCKTACSLAIKRNSVIKSFINMNSKSFVRHAWIGVLWDLLISQQWLRSASNPGPSLDPQSLTFSSLLAESGLRGQQGGVHYCIHRELSNCMIYTYWLPPAVTIARAKTKHA